MHIVTTPTVPGRDITDALGIVHARVVAGVNFLHDFLASFADTFGGRSVTYQWELDRMQQQLVHELQQRAKQLGADAVVGVRIDYDSIAAQGKSMFLASAVGTAVALAPLDNGRPTFGELATDASSVDVRRVLDAVKYLLSWADAYSAGQQLPLSRKGEESPKTAAEWAAAVEREGGALVDRFTVYLRTTPSARAKLLLAHLLTLAPDRERVLEAAQLLEDVSNRSTFEGIAERVSLHWPLVTGQLAAWLKQGGPYRALAMHIIAHGANTSMRLADLDDLESLLRTVREISWSSGTPSGPTWKCACSSTPIAIADARCPQCGLLTRGVTQRDAPYHPAQLLGYLTQQHRLLAFLQPSRTRSSPQHVALDA